MLDRCAEQEPLPDASERKSRPKASKKATKAIAAAAGVSKQRQSAGRIPSKYRRSKKSPRLLEGTLTARKASHIERLANAREAKGLARIVGYSDDPIQTIQSRHSMIVCSS
jgi:hypothetical protein